MKPSLVFENARVFLGDCRDVLKDLPDNSVDSIVTDPPYELGFMGKKWDSSGIAYDVTVWSECLRVLKPGGHILAFGGSRTWHRLAVAVEDAGFELRDSIAWIYGSGFPKSLDVSKAIDKKAGAEREVSGITKGAGIGGGNTFTDDNWKGIGRDHYERFDIPASDEAQKWQGWGTALKPAFEPVVVGRKPIQGTVASNVLEWGVGGLNIDGSRIPSGDTIPQMSGKSVLGGSSEGWDRPWKNDPEAVKARENRAKNAIDKANSLGRWPANVILDEVTAGLLDEQTGDETSRFFYQAKASKRDRNEGLNLCQCDKLAVWENEDQTAPPQADTDQSTPKGIGASGTPNNGDSEWNTSSSGNSTTANSKTGNKSTTSTGTSSTTELTTLSPLTVSPTNDSTQDASSEMGSGGSRVNSAASQSPSELNTGTSARKGGLNTGGADPVTSELSSGQSNVGSHQCAKCLGIIGGHPTVKPTALMRYLIKLVTPPGGTVLDPFTGSGSTGKAALLDGFEFIGAELTEEYLPIIEGRLKWAVENREEKSLF